MFPHMTHLFTVYLPSGNQNDTQAHANTMQVRISHPTGVARPQLQCTGVVHVYQQIS